MPGDDPSGNTSRKAFVVGVIVFAGIAISYTGHRVLTAKEERLLATRFERDMAQCVSSLSDRIRSSAFRIMGVSPRGRADPSVPPTVAFRESAARRLEVSQDTLALVWLPRVPAADRLAHEQMASELGIEGYQIHQRDAGGNWIVPPTDNGDEDYYPILVEATIDQGPSNVGYDLRSVEACREAIDRSIALARMSVTRPVPWDDESGKRWAIFAFRGIHEARTLADTPEVLHEKLLGFVVGVIDIHSIVQETLASSPPGINVWLYDKTPEGNSRLICVYNAVSKTATFAENFSESDAPSGPNARTTSLGLPQFPWSVACEPTEEFIAESRAPVPPIAVFAFGCLVTAIVAAYANTLLGRNAQVERQVIQRTTELHEANDQLAYERFLLNTLLDNSPDFIYFKDTDGRFIRVGQMLARHHGFAGPAATVGKTDFDTFPADVAQQYFTDEQQIIASGVPLTDKVEEQLASDGRHVWVSTTKVPLKEPDGTIIGTFGISRDITSRKQAENALAAAKDAAEAASRAKSDFLTNMSHEIRTPLNAVIGMTELVLDTDLLRSQREYLKMGLESAESLLSIINDILDFAKVEAGKLELEPAPFQLRELLGDTLRCLAFRAHSKDLELCWCMDDSVPEHLIGDGNRLRQIIVNLVANAIKFTDQGEVMLSVSRDRTDEHSVMLHFRVTDTGIGVAKDKLAKIFEVFEQVDPSITRRFGGSGLGLSICSRLVSLMNGTIWVESEIAHGSTFHFTAQVAQAESHPSDDRMEILADKRVLVVDDNDNCRRILAKLLTKWRMQPVLAGNAHDAIAACQQARTDDQPFELLISDVDLPDESGFALVERVRAEAVYDGPVIMLLASAGRTDDIAKCEQLGVDASLLKPAKHSELSREIMSAFSTGSPERQLEAETPAKTLFAQAPLHILLVEDSIVNQKLALGLLQRNGHSVVVASNGQEALEVIDREDFDLILMDVQMPVMDGFEATRQIRAREERTSQHTPVIAMTAHALKGVREDCLAAGMDGYVAKPIRVRQLVEKIQDIMGAQKNH